MIPRYLAIEEHFGENDFGWEMFRKLRLHQSSEFGDGHGQKLYDQTARNEFEVLIDSVKKHGFKRRFPLIINHENFKITKVGCVLRVVCIEIDKIPCKYDTIDPTDGYDLNWMQNDVGYTSKELIKLLRVVTEFSKIESSILDVVIEDEENAEEN